MFSIFIILIGTILIFAYLNYNNTITAGGFFIYEKVSGNNSNNNGMPSMNGGNGQMQGGPGGNGEEPPEKPDGDNKNTL